jgi:hypothetical protein
MIEGRFYVLSPSVMIESGNGLRQEGMFIKMGCVSGFATACVLLSPAP